MTDNNKLKEVQSLLRTKDMLGSMTKHYYNKIGMTEYEEVAQVFTSTFLYCLKQHNIVKRKLAQSMVDANLLDCPASVESDIQC